MIYAIDTPLEATVSPAVCTWEDRSRISKQMPELFRFLFKQEVLFVLLAYESKDGEGKFTSVTLISKRSIDSEPVAQASQSFEVFAFFGNMLAARDTRWKEGDGTEGEILWDLLNDTVTHEHYAREATPAKPTGVRF